jgi:hypothetical protein
VIVAGTYALNATVLVRGRFYAPDGQPTDPSGVSLRIRSPHGVTTSYLFTDPDTIINRVSEGIYTAIVRGNVVGRWGYQWSSTTPDDTGSQPADEGFFDIKPSSFG